MTLHDTDWASLVIKMDRREKRRRERKKTLKETHRHLIASAVFS